MNGDGIFGDASYLGSFIVLLEYLSENTSIDYLKTFSLTTTLVYFNPKRRSAAAKMNRYCCLSTLPAQNFIHCGNTEQ